MCFLVSDFQQRIKKIMKNKACIQSISKEITPDGQIRKDTQILVLLRSTIGYQDRYIQRNNLQL